MSWNKEHYEAIKAEVEHNLKTQKKTPYDYMVEYQNAVREEDYERCKALTEVLEEYNYKTVETHKYIREIL